MFETFWSFRYSDLGFVSYFDFRASDFPGGSGPGSPEKPPKVPLSFI
jgi:hypothetical protein